MPLGGHGHEGQLRPYVPRWELTPGLLLRKERIMNTTIFSETTAVQAVSDKVSQDAAQQAHTVLDHVQAAVQTRSEEHTSELQSLMRISYAVFCLKKKNRTTNTILNTNTNESERRP